MAIELYREGSEAFQLEYFGIWEKLMDLAHIYGWVPAGTSEPPAWDEEGEAAEWSGRYDVYLGEWVDEADANALADALHNALPDLPDDRTYQLWLVDGHGPRSAGTTRPAGSVSSTRPPMMIIATNSPNAGIPIAASMAADPCSSRGRR